MAENGERPTVEGADEAVWIVAITTYRGNRHSRLVIARSAGEVCERGEIGATLREFQANHFDQSDLASAHVDRLYIDPATVKPSSVGRASSDAAARDPQDVSGP